MRKAIVEVLGAFFAAAPVSYDAEGQKARQLVVGIILLMILVIGWFALSR